LWPRMSPSRPTPRSSALTTSRYAVTTHSMVATLAPSARLMIGSIVLTTLASSADMNVPTPTAVRIHHLRGAGCACDADYVAQQYTELDTQPSVTCVPKTPTVDLRAGGLVLPDACAGVSCAAGTCIDRNGVAVCQCTAGNGAVTSYSSSAPTCTPITTPSGGLGAQDYSEPLRGLAVCAPKPPVCGPDGWLVKTGSLRPGVDCGDTQPAPELTREPPAPSCPGVFGCSGCDVPGTAPIGALGGAWLVALLVFRRRRA